MIAPDLAELLTLTTVCCAVLLLIIGIVRTMLREPLGRPYLAGGLALTALAIACILLIAP